MSTTSGIVFVFWPPCTTFGDTVVCEQAWAMRASPGSSEAIASSMRAGSVSARTHVVGQVHRLDPGPPEVVELWLPAVGRQAAHDLGRGDEGVVGAERHRAVARGAVDAQAQPG